MTLAVRLDDDPCLVAVLDYDLWCFDDETRRFEPIETPFGPNVLPMSPE